MRMTMTVEVPDDIDATTTDPHEIGEEMVIAYNDDLRANYRNAEQVAFVGAEWRTS